MRAPGHSHRTGRSNPTTWCRARVRTCHCRGRRAQGWRRTASMHLRVRRAHGAAGGPAADWAHNARPPRGTTVIGTVASVVSDARSTISTVHDTATSRPTKEIGPSVRHRTGKPALLVPAHRLMPVGLVDEACALGTQPQSHRRPSRRRGRPGDDARDGLAAFADVCVETELRCGHRRAPRAVMSRPLRWRDRPGSARRRAQRSSRRRARPAPRSPR